MDGLWKNEAQVNAEIRSSWLQLVGEGANVPVSDGEG